MQKCEQLDYSLECLQGISDNIPTLTGHGMKFIEIFIPKAQNLKVYSISDFRFAQAYSHFLEVQSKFSRYESRNLWQKAFLAIHVMSAQERRAIRSSAAEL